VRHRQIERSLHVGIDVPQGDADIPARHAAARAQLREDRGRAADRDGEADAARARADGRIDADDVAVGVDQRAAAVAEIDRGVGLNVVVEAAVEELASEEADHADRHCVLVAERVADRADPLTHAERRRIAERRNRQTGLAVDFDHRDVGVGVGADHPRTEAAAVGQLHGDPLGAVDDVIVRQDAAVGVDDEAAAGAAVRRVAIRPRRVEVERPVEQVRRIGWPGAPLPPSSLVALRRRIDVHDGRIDPLDDVGEIDRCGRADRVRRRTHVGHVRCPGDDRGPVEPAGEDGADEKGDDRCERHGHEGEAAGHKKFVGEPSGEPDARLKPRASRPSL
jgi:hypothetical protein